ncbi:hypothetical protein BV911_04460, partial [Pseudoruegeria sp. SK021]
MKNPVLSLATGLCLIASGALAQATSGETQAADAAEVQASSGDDSVELAKKLSNPIANLISVPFQYNYNSGYGADGDGEQSYVNIQPVIPFSISEDWNVISRTILPVVSQNGIVPGEGDQFGFGNTVQSFFFSPKAPTSAGLIWGVGPVIQLPTTTDNITNPQWAAGIT